MMSWSDPFAYKGIPDGSQKFDAKSSPVAKSIQKKLKVIKKKENSKAKDTIARELRGSLYRLAFLKALQQTIPTAAFPSGILSTKRMISELVNGCAFKIIAGTSNSP